jgi:hypothetical protein
MIFNMSTKDNFASFIDEDSGLAVFVDSYDNREFEVRIGTTQESTSVGIIHASTDDELNIKLADLLQIHQEGKQ